MTSFLRTVPAILWGASFANVLHVGYFLDNVKSGDQPRDGSEWVQSPSGVEEAWITGTDFYIEFDVRWIPQVDTASPVATGWDGTTGVREFLKWARQKNAFRFVMDATSLGTYILSYLVDPTTGYPDPEDDGTRKIRLRIRNASTAYDGY